MLAAQTMPDIATIWHRFKATGDQALRNILMETYLPVVKYNAERLCSRLSDEVDCDDLVSAGVFGLADAINSFDLSRGVRFETYCAPRIRGAMLDELRNLDWVPRIIRSRAAKLEEANRTLEAELGRAPDDDELADRLKLPHAKLDKFKRDGNAVAFVSLSHPHYATKSSKDICAIDLLEDERGKNPLLETQKRDLKDMVTRGLSRAERLVLILYYYEAMSMKEIGTVLDLSESRISQMRSSVIERLRCQFRHRREVRRRMENGELRMENGEWM
ncbi:MAG: FliA/WhiG family RNA polymerase sigma factor [Phycisphaerae bacterium]|nr:FliA/WhiG family RNA polymerase sigma factor [Phycisphaerae bacterium]